MPTQDASAPRSEFSQPPPEMAEKIKELISMTGADPESIEADFIFLTILLLRARHVSRDAGLCAGIHLTRPGYVCATYSATAAATGRADTCPYRCARRAPPPRFPRRPP